ncbi:MAG: RCC1 domain-containing protein, partial [Chloroflexota bacterium]
MIVQGRGRAPVPPGRRCIHFLASDRHRRAPPGTRGPYETTYRPPPARLIARLAVATLTLAGLALWMHTPATAAVRTLAVATAQAFVEVTTGIDYSCGLTASGAAYCWGFNDVGQVGDNTTANKNVPTLVSNPSGPAVTWSKIAAGGSHTCAITTTNAAYCWGANSERQLGDGTTADRNVPTLVSNPSGGAVQWSQIDAGKTHTCAITTN